MRLYGTIAATAAAAIVLLGPGAGAAGGQTPGAAGAQTAGAAGAQAGPTVVYLVRHAETTPDGTADPALSEPGARRAERLAGMLAAAGLTAIHSTPYRRTRATAGAVADRTGMAVLDYDPRDLAAFAGTLRRSGGRHLVVGHSNTTPELVRLLGGEPGPPIPESEYGRVYVLTIPPDGVHTAILGYPEDRGADPPG